MVGWAGTRRLYGARITDMAVRPSSLLSLPSMLRTLLGHVRLGWRLLRDPAVPSVLKLLPFAAGLYLLFPLDGLPDFIPVVGQLDDLGVLALALESFVRLCPSDAVTFHQAAIRDGQPFRPSSPRSGTRAGDGPIIDAEFRREPDPRDAAPARPGDLTRSKPG